MDTFEKIGYLCLGAVALIYVGSMFVVGTRVGWLGGLVGLLIVLGIGVLLIKVVRERRGSAEDDYYVRNIDK